MTPAIALAAMAVPVGAAILGRRWLRSGRLTRRSTPPAPDPPDVTDLAYVAGGSYRVVLSAVAALRHAALIDARG
jgi:uncharacterized protein (TIGR04222 family)